MKIKEDKRVIDEVPQSQPSALDSTTNRISSFGMSTSIKKGRNTINQAWEKLGRFTSNDVWKVPMIQMSSKELIKRELWEEVANCLSNADNISGENKLGDDGFDLLAITCYKYINQAMNNA